MLVISYDKLFIFVRQSAISNMLEHIKHHFTIFLALSALFITAKEDLERYSANELVVESTPLDHILVYGPEFIEVIIVPFAILFVID